MKKIVVAFDSFKGSLGSVEAAEAFISGFREVCPDTESHIVAISDGGEGMAEAVVYALGGDMVAAKTHDPLNREITASYGVIDEGATAVISMASASGLTLLRSEERNPLITTTYGTGELLLDAVARGCRRIIVGLGGSATNDGGVGMLRALGYKFFDTNGVELVATIDILECVESIIAPKVNPFQDIELSVAVDVNNPLCGERGASMVYGAQKGATMDTFEKIVCLIKNNIVLENSIELKREVDFVEVKKKEIIHTGSNRSRKDHVHGIPCGESGWRRIGG